MINENTLNKLEEVLVEIVSDTDSGSWREKKDFIEAQLSEEGQNALEEFVEWWEET